MKVTIDALLVALVLIAAWYVWRWVTLGRARGPGAPRAPRPADVLVGFGTDFFERTQPDATGAG